MNQENFSLVRQSVAGPLVTDDEKLLESLRITRSKELPPMEFLFRICGIPCFPRGELVGVTGKAKSGKTLFISMLMACCVRDEVLQVQRPFEDMDGIWKSQPVRCLWFDTEQSEKSTQEILLDRIGKLMDSLGQTLVGDAEWEDYYDVFNCRKLHYDERLRLFEKAVRKYSPALVVLDGVRDLLADINDGVKAQEIVERLMKLAQETDTCIICVLHQNKGTEDRNLRGWIGTELMNKAFEVYACEKVKPENIFVVEQTHTRKYDLDELLFFKIDQESGLPVVCEAPTRYSAMSCISSSVHANGQNGNLSPMNREYLIFDENNKPHPKSKELFYEALKTGPMFYTDLQKKVQSLLNCGTPMWNNMFCDMRNQGFIVRSKNNEGKAVWILAGSGDSPSS